MATKYKIDTGWVVQYKGTDGKWHQKRVGKNATAQDAETLRKMYDAEELNYRHKAVVRVVKKSIDDVLDEYVKKEINTSTVSNGSKECYCGRIKMLKRQLREAGVKDTKDVTPSIVQDIFTKMIPDYKPKSILLHRAVTNQFFLWAIKKGYCTDNPTEIVRSPKIQKGLPRFFSEDELTRIFDTTPEPYKSLFRFLYLTGLRIGEASNLRWTDYVPQRKHIVIRNCDGNKTKREEIVPLNESAIAIIKERQANAVSDYIFTREKGSKLETSYTNNVLKATLKKLNIKSGTLHTFRHTFASHLVIRGVSLYTVCKLLRHSSIRMTEIYAHLSEETVASAVETLTA